MDFVPTERTLGLGSEWVTVLDNTNPQVVALKTNFPGYWMNTDNAVALLQSEQIFTCNDIIPRFAELLEDTRDERKAGLMKTIMRVVDLPFEQTALSQGSNLTALLQDIPAHKLLDFFRNRRYFHYLRPLLTENLQTMLIQQAGDGPFSSIIPSDRWRQSAVQLLNAAHENAERR
jgi:hypothetical protein